MPFVNTERLGSVLAGGADLSDRGEVNQESESSRVVTTGLLNRGNSFRDSGFGDRLLANRRRWKQGDPLYLSSYRRRLLREARRN